MGNQSIEDLKGAISSNRGMAEPTLFRVIFPSINTVSSRELNLLCTNVNLPGRQIMTQERKLGVISQKVGYDQATEDVNLTFRLMNDYGVRKYFEAWQNMIVDQDSHEIGYLETYGKTVKIQQLKKGFSFPIYNKSLGLPTLPSEIQNRLPEIGPFDFAQGELDLDFINSEQIVYEVELQHAFPTTMNEALLNDDARDSILEMSVQLSYRKWKSKYPGQSDSILSQVAGTLLTNIGSKF